MQISLVHSILPVEKSLRNVTLSATGPAPKKDCCGVLISANSIGLAS